MHIKIKRLLKYLMLVLCTILVTAVVFRLVRPPRVRHFEVVEHPLPPLVETLRNYVEQKDWHNYVQIREEADRKGPGEQGQPAYLGSEDDSHKASLYRVNGFNALLSDRIALNRSLPDIRHKGCKSKRFISVLPDVSVIIPFHNEHLSTLVRTATSVVNRSPPQLLKEIILVDDFSSKPSLGVELDNYIKHNMPKVRVLRLPERSGLIRARLAGARQAKAKVLVFLDSHTEANVNWLPPLLEPIAKDSRTCVCPFIDVIDFETFAYRAQDEGARGGFDWELYYKRLPLLPEDLERPTEPFRSPVMAGGLFAIDKDFFWELGGYDSGLEIWGGEQYELSFKIWQCGGQMLDSPCSRVGHIYRKFAPFPNPGKGDFVGRNYRRVAEVWMDNWAQYLYKRRPHYLNIDPGDLSEQRELRNRLHCKDFDWFMREIAFDLPKRYPPVEPPDFAKGEIRSVAAPELCVDTTNAQADERVKLSECIKDTSYHGKKREQNFTLTWHKDVRPQGRLLCWDVSDPGDRAAITLYACHGQQGNQLWRYQPEQQWLIQGGNHRCMDADPGAKRLYVTKCDVNAKTQQWRFEHVDLKALANWHSMGPL